ncbi:hypothetical protein ACUW92_002148 [Staphylococcus epidermidis]|uniref:hypothetical protein n=1 Tax=Staphylococcus epidermidis TaxID=1282 RepID=UPI001933AFA8|nr:hypothetical protein [Staphylococcus epidermidis]MBM0846224.1 hypothetical protein [Staphylococcus epidermidis]
MNLQGKLKQNIFENDDNNKTFYTYMLVISFEITDPKEITEMCKSKRDEQDNSFDNTDKKSIYDDVENGEDYPF